MDLLGRIKSAVVRGDVVFTEKARSELEQDNLLEIDVLESILNAGDVRLKRSRNVHRRSPAEKVCIIEAISYAGILIYTKGVLRREGGHDEIYVPISSKRSVASG